MTVSNTKSTASDIAALLRARNPLLWVVTPEEARVERHLIEAANAAKYDVRLWDVAQGFTLIDGETYNEDAKDPGAALSFINDAARRTRKQDYLRTVWIMRDLAPFLSGQIGITTNRAMRNLARLLPDIPRDNAQAIIVLTPSSDIPPELQGHATVIDWPLPDRAEIALILDANIKALPDDMQANAAPNGERDKAIDAAVGLSGEQASACYAKSLVQTKRIDPAVIASEKKRIVSRDKVLSWLDPLSGGLDSVGGLESYKQWLLQRVSAYSPAARAYGIKPLKGVLLVGVPGCGKSMVAKATATVFQSPLVGMDINAGKSKFVGDSEASIRRAYETIKALGKSVVLIDEIEKSLQGATSGSSDGGVSADALGSMLSWLQEKTDESFVMATANNIASLPPELLRKGRFDEIFFVDLPHAIEREAILASALRSVDRDPASIDLAAVASVTEDFTGSEIASLVPDALFVSFADNQRALTTDDILAAAKTVVPLARTASEKIDALRKWAQGNARPASLLPVVSEIKRARKLDIV
jgi:AAA+ superfamily predicted ATPase